MSASRSTRKLMAEVEKEGEEMLKNGLENSSAKDEFAFEANFDDISPAAIAMGTGTSSKLRRSKSERCVLEDGTCQPLTSSKIRRNLSEKYDQEQKELQNRCGELKVKPSSITAKDFANWEDLQQNGGMNKLSPRGPPSKRDGLVKSMSKRSVRGGLTGLGLMRQKSYRGLDE